MLSGPIWVQIVSKGYQQTLVRRDIGFPWPNSHMIDNNQINECPVKRKSAHTPRSCGSFCMYHVHFGRNKKKKSFLLLFVGWAWKKTPVGKQYHNPGISKI